MIDPHMEDSEVDVDKIKNCYMDIVKYIEALQATRNIDPLELTTIIYYTCSRLVTATLVATYYERGKTLSRRDRELKTMAAQGLITNFLDGLMREIDSKMPFNIQLQCDFINFRGDDN